MTPWTTARQAPLPIGIPRQEYWRGLPFPSPGDIPDPGITPMSPELQAGSLPLSHQGSPVIGCTLKKIPSPTSQTDLIRESLGKEHKNILKIPQMTLLYIYFWKLRCYTNSEVRIISIQLGKWEKSTKTS